MVAPLNKKYHEKNKVRVGGRGQALKGFSPKDVADLQKNAESKKGGSKKAVPLAATKKSKRK
jgi:hypothetical protein